MNTITIILFSQYVREKTPAIDCLFVIRMLKMLITLLGHNNCLNILPRFTMYLKNLDAKTIACTLGKWEKRATEMKTL